MYLTAIIWDALMGCLHSPQWRTEEFICSDAEMAAKKQTSVPCSTLQLPCLKNDTLLLCRLLPVVMFGQQRGTKACHSFFSSGQYEGPLWVESSPWSWLRSSTETVCPDNPEKGTDLVISLNALIQRPVTSRGLPHPLRVLSSPFPLFLSETFWLVTTPEGQKSPNNTSIPA